MKIASGRYFVKQKNPGVSLEKIPNRIEQYGRQVKEYYSTRGPDQIFDYDEYTLSEHYSPYYGHMIGDRIAEIARKDLSYQIIEVGGGRGRFAFDLLSRLKEEHPDVFKRVNYILLDISYPLQTCQRSLLKNYPVRFITTSATHLPFAEKALQNSIVISNEVIADLPSIIPAAEEDVPGDVLNLAGRANITLSNESYLNVGALQFLLEIKRTLASGSVIIIEYGVDSKPRPRTLGGENNCHPEVAINKKDLCAAARTLFPKATIGPLIDLIGENVLQKMIKSPYMELPDNLIQWLFDLMWMTERLAPKMLDKGALNRIFLEEEQQDERALQRIKAWQEKLSKMEVSNRHERMFLENLTSLFISFDEMFGSQAATQLFEGFQKVHQLGTKTLLRKTICADRTFFDEGQIDEDFFFLLCRV